MTTDEFFKVVSQAIINNRTADSAETVECVWYGYIFGNIKGMFVVANADGTPDDIYYEATYNKASDDIWIQAYVKDAMIKL